MATIPTKANPPGKLVPALPAQQEFRLHTTRLNPSVIVLHSPDRPRGFALFLPGGTNACRRDGKINLPRQ
ncbi:MAG: hypothetical protein JNM45_08030 [Rhizobiales bacterium]|nr:hypothetical protein [Hyphomicrobiales bacterium]